jgi:hypothetical protein
MACGLWRDNPNEATCLTKLQRFGKHFPPGDKINSAPAPNE